MSQPFITIVDYGGGNIRSVIGAFGAVGAACSVENDPERVAGCSALVLPGVGSYRSAMDRLDQSGMALAIEQAFRSGARILGVCLGMQLLGEWSDEDGGRSGIGIVPGTYRRFVPDPVGSIRVPHTGFNSVRSEPSSILFERVPVKGDFYFAHSYRFVASLSKPELTVATTDYGGEFVSAFEMNTQVFGVQFHPELSQGNGLQLLSNFVRCSSC